MSTPCFDGLVHLDDQRIPAQERPMLFERAHQAKVRAVLNGGVNPLTADIAQLERIRQEAKAEDVDMHWAFGLHPRECGEDVDVDAAMERLKELAPRAVAVGEIGLDYRKGSPDRDRQREVLNKQLTIATEFNLPVVMHTVKAWEDLFATLDLHPKVRGVVHAFSGAGEVYRELTKRGLLVSIGQGVLFSNAKRLHSTLAKLGGDLRHLMVETDAPDHPQGNRKWAEPADLEAVIGAIARRTNRSEEEVARTTAWNARNLFQV